MREIRARGYTVVGVGAVNVAKYIDDTGDPVDLSAYRINEETLEPEELTPIIGVLADPFCYIYAEINISDGRSLTGSVTPNDALISISLLGANDEITYDTLVRRRITYVRSSSNTWVWSNSGQLNGSVVVWLKIDTVSDALQSRITIQGADGGGDVPSGGGGAACETCGGTGYILTQETCPTCEGSGEVDGQICPTCGGTGTIEIESTCPQCNGTGLVCLTGDTMISMANGELRRLDQLCVGEYVKGDDGPTKVAKIMIGHHSHYHKKYLFSNGTVIDETGPHRFYNIDRGFWLQLDRWEIGDHAKTENGSSVELISVTVINDHEDGYAMWTENGTYYANGLLCGTAQANQKLLADATSDLVVDMVNSLSTRDILELTGWADICPDEYGVETR